MRTSINGTIVADGDKWLYDWFEIPAVCPAELRRAIADTPEGETLTVEFNSGGGDVFAGFEMYSLLRQAPCPTVAEVQSLAASAASTVMVGCGKVLLSPVAQVMIHMPVTDTYGNEDDHMQSVGILQSILVSIINGYELRCCGKADRAKLEALVRESSWLSAQDALALGLADGILGGGEGLTMDSRVMNAANAPFAGQTPTRAALLAEYRRRVANGAAPAAGHEEAAAPPAAPSVPTGTEPEQVSDDWADEAYVIVEKERTNIY